MNPPGPLYLLLAVLCAAYVGLALAEKRTAAARFGYAVVSFLLLLCGQAVLSYDGPRSAIPAEVRAALSTQRSATAMLGAWLAVMAAGELVRVVLSRRPAVEALGPTALLLGGGTFAEPGVGPGVGFGLAAAALAVVGAWGPGQGDALTGPARVQEADRS